MSKRKILAALKRKGVETSECEYGQHVCPGEIVGAWTIVLTEESIDRILDSDPGFDDFEPDCFNSSEVLEWVETLPTLGAKP